VIKAADMMIARRADTRARADFATWNMMAKLNGTSSLPAEAQSFLEQYGALLKEMTEAEATEAIIQSIYRSYYEGMGGAGEAPNVRLRTVGDGQKSGKASGKVSSKASSNVTAFKRPPPQKPKNAGASQTGSRLPVALIFACLVIVYTGFRYFFR
jgi:hypothetical protein